MNKRLSFLVRTTFSVEFAGICNKNSPVHAHWDFGRHLLLIFKLIWNFHSLLFPNFFICTITFWIFLSYHRSIKRLTRWGHQSKHPTSCGSKSKLPNSCGHQRLFVNINSCLYSFWYCGSAFYLILPFTAHKKQPSAEKNHHRAHKIQPPAPKNYHTHSPTPTLTALCSVDSIVSNITQKNQYP